MGKDALVSDRSYQGECKICGWTGPDRDSFGEAEEDAAEHMGYCSQTKESS